MCVCVSWSELEEWGFQNKSVPESDGRINKEVKRRTRVATLFPNEASLLRLVSAVLTEISDEWETGRVYLTLQDG